MAQLSNYAICYEAIQRVYRNAVLDVARRRLQERYPDWPDQIERLYGSEWQRMVDAADEPWRSGLLENPCQDELDYLGVNHFYNLFQKFFDVIFQYRDQLPENRRRGERERVFNLAKQIHTLRNHISHPSEGDLPFESAFQGLNAARRILEKLDKNEPARRVRELLDQLHGRGAVAWPTPVPQGESPPPSHADARPAPPIARSTSQPSPRPRTSHHEVMIQDVDQLNARIFFDGYMYVGGRRHVARPQYFAPYLTRECTGHPNLPPGTQAGIRFFSEVFTVLDRPVKDILDGVEALKIDAEIHNHQLWSRWEKGLEDQVRRAREESGTGRKFRPEIDPHRLYFLEEPVDLGKLLTKPSNFAQIPWGFGCSLQCLTTSSSLAELLDCKRASGLEVTR